MNFTRGIVPHKSEPEDSVHPETGQSSLNHDLQHSPKLICNKNTLNINCSIDDIPAEDPNIQILELFRSILPHISLVLPDKDPLENPADPKTEPKGKVLTAAAPASLCTRKDRFVSSQNTLGELSSKGIIKAKYSTQMYPNTRNDNKNRKDFRSKTTNVERDRENGGNLESAEDQITTKTHALGTKALPLGAKALPFPKKKWVFCRICRIGFSEDTMMKAFKYLDTLDLTASKEVILQRVLEYLESEFTTAERKIAIQAIQKKPNMNSRTLKKEHSLETNMIFEMDSENDDNDVFEPREDTSCKICYSRMKSTKICSFLSCKHEFCTACTKDYLEDCILSFKVLNIKCPHEGCKFTFEDEHLKNIIDSDLFKKYLRFKHAAVLNQNSNIRWCIRAGCEKYMIGEPNSSFLKCECGQEICFDCCNEYHAGKTCGEMIDLIYKEYAKQVDIQLCNSCKSRVEKDDGCNHIKCSVCGNEWCWLCGAKYTKHHYSLLNPFGCSGLQSGTHTKSKWPLWKRLIWKSFRILIILMLILLLPVIGLGAVSAVPLILYRRRQASKRPLRGDVSLFKSFLLIVLGVLAIPFTIIFCFVYFVFALSRGSAKSPPVSGRPGLERNPTNESVYTKQTEKAAHRKAITNTTTGVPRQNDDEDQRDDEGERSDESIPSENRFQVVNID